MPVSVKPSEEILKIIKEDFEYDSETGDLWRFNYNLNKWTKVVIRLYYNASQNRWGVGQVSICRNGNIVAQLRPHNICWFLYYKEWPDREVDHEDIDQTNNKITNLKLATPSLQKINQSHRTRTYLPGVFPQYYRLKIYFYSAIKYKGKRYHLGTFKTELAAHLAYRAKYKELHGEELPPFISWHKPVIEELPADEAAVNLAEPSPL